MLDATNQPTIRTLPASTTALIAAALTLVAALIGLRLQDEGIAVFWPAAGIGAGLMLLARNGQRRHVAAGILAALAAANALHHRPFLAALVFMAGNLAEAYIVARLLERAYPRRFAIDRAGRAALFVAVAMVGPALVAVATSLFFELAGYGQAGLATRWWLWLSSHAVGILCVMPAVLAIGSSRAGRWLTAEDAGQLVVAASVSLVLVGGLLPESSIALLVAALLIVPLALWVVIDAGPRRAALSLLALSLVTIWQTSSQAGLFGGDVTRAQLFLLAISLLLLGIGVARLPGSWQSSVRLPRMTELQAAVVLVPAVFLALVGWWTWRGIEAAAITKVERLASAFAVHAERVLEAQRTIAGAALAHVAGRDVAGITNDRSVHEFLSRLAKASATPSAISLIDVASGRAVADSTDFPPREFDFSDRDYVRAARAASYETHISGVIPRFPSGLLGFTVSSVTPDQRLLAVTRPELKELLELIATLREHKNDVINIVREDGVILARQPWPENGTTKLPPNSFTLRLLRKEVTGTSVQFSAIDGRQRLVAMRRAGQLPVYAIYGLDWARVRGEWLRQLAPLGLVSIVASLLLGSFVSRAQRAEVSAATARIERDAQRRLRKSEERFRLLVEQSADGIFVSDARGRYVEVNPAGCEMLGFTREEILARTIADVVMPEEQARVPLETGRLAGGGVVKSEWRFRRKDGSAFIGEVVARQLPDGQLQAILRDITERHDAEIRLRGSEERLRAIVDTAADSIVVVDEAGIIQSVNPATGRMFGYSQDELAGLNVSVLMPEEQASTHDFHVAVYRETETARIIGSGREVKGRRKDGTSFDADLAIAEWHAAGRRFFTGIMRDITERKRNERKIQHLLTELNHRAKNLLGVVQAIAMQTASSNPQAFMESFSERLEGLAASQDLLVESQWHGIEIDALARAQLAHFANLIGERIVLAGPRVRIQAAAAQTIGMALHELATNAGKYGALSNAGGRVRIEWKIASAPGKAQALVLGWSEDGGPPVTQPSRRGFGTTIIDTMPRMSLDGDVRLEYPPSGLRWTLICPAAAVVEASDDDDKGVRDRP
jgi:PAS domain S-box-containing protein